MDVSSPASVMRTTLSEHRTGCCRVARCQRRRPAKAALRVREAGYHLLQLLRTDVRAEGLGGGLQLDTVGEPSHDVGVEAQVIDQAGGDREIRRSVRRQADRLAFRDA